MIIAIDQSNWLTDLKRSVQHYGYKYDYRARRIDLSMHMRALPDLIIPICNQLVAANISPVLPDQRIVNE